MLQIKNVFLNIDEQDLWILVHFDDLKGLDSKEFWLKLGRKANNKG